LLNLKRNQLSEKLDDFKSQLDSAAKQEKARAEQDLISRGLAKFNRSPKYAASHRS